MNDDVDVYHEVPDTLQRLVRFIVRGFYGIEHGLAVDVLVRNSCVKEEDIQELLKFDKKQLRVVLHQLKNDKFLKSRPYVETQDDGRVTRHNYYYINYRSVANVIKYKLHHMHKRIETMERDNTNRPSFKCPECENTYSDLEVNQLIDPYTGQLKCTFCHTEVVEDQAASSAQDGRTLQAKFNEQMEPVYKLLKEVENVNLSEEVLEPKPADIPHLHPGGPRISKPKVKNEDNWSSGRPGASIVQQQDVVIDLGVESKDEHKAKEVPIWMKESTVTGAASLQASSSGGALKPTVETDSKSIDDEVLQTLLVQERSSKAPPRLPYSHPPEEADDSDEFEDVEEDEEMVMVAGKSFSYEEVTRRGPELINLMSSHEKDCYIRIGQRLYEDMDD